jgi:hypothetical protein
MSSQSKVGSRLPSRFQPAIFGAGIGWLVSGLLGMSMLTGCVVTGATGHHRAESGSTAAVPQVANPAGILISEMDWKEGPYLDLGEVSAWARSVNLLSSNPTRADVDEALRAAAAKRGADAVILVHYRSERTGLASRGKLTAVGRAVSFKR